MDTKKLIDLAMKNKSANLVFKNAKIVNVFSHEIITGDVAVHDGIIVGIGNYDGAKNIDLQGKFIVPGLIDSHVHIESSMVSPTEFTKAVVPRGTTTVIADPHEIANVCGLEGIDYMLKASENLPLDVYLMLPSCVPATNFENSGAILKAKDLEKFINHPRVLGLGEMMNYPGVIYKDEEVINKILIKTVLEAIMTLDEEEKWLIQELFFCGKSQRKLSKETGIPLMTITNRKKRVLKKLKKHLKF